MVRTVHSIPWVHLLSSRALPTVIPALVDSCAIPGVFETVRRSPAFIFPFSSVTFTGTLPARAIGLGLLAPSSKSPPIMSFGTLDTTPTTLSPVTAFLSIEVVCNPSFAS